MVSRQKRIQYVSDNEEITSEEESYDDSDSATQKQNDSFTNGNERMPTRKPKCFSRNALMARENRLKKKMYLTNLEREVSTLKNENKKVTSIMENQSFMISELRKEIKYLKSVIANSSDISKLVRNIHQSTGMSVSTSLDKTLSFNNCVSKRTIPIARKTAHPWDENNVPPSYSMVYPSPPSESDTLFESFNTDDILMMNVSPIETIPVNLFEENLNTNLSLEEHSYTTKLLDNNEISDDVGVCLHVSKHKVSLEFCQSCNENASEGWMD